MREQFEKLPEIKEMLLNNDELKWCYETNRYINHRVFQDAETGYINGAWYAFQEQQKKIDGALKELELLNYYRTGNSDNAIKILKGTGK